MLKFSATLISRFDSLRRHLWSQGARDFLAALALLAAALYLAFQSENAVRRGEPSLGVFFAATSLILALTTAVLLVPRMAKRVKFSRWWVPMSFSITGEGGIYLLGVFLLSLAAMNSGNNLLFMILALMLSAIIASGVFARASLRAVSVSMDVPENVFVGERVALKVSLRNRNRFFPAISISVEDLGLAAARHSAALRRGAPGEKTGDRGNHEPDRPVLRNAAYFPIVPAGDARTELLSQTFPARGRYHLEGFRLSTRFPFGFFRRGERVRAEGEVLVYPRILEVSSYFHLLPFQPGHLEGRRVGPGESLYAIRNYLDGESARLLDWKATAKTGELMARSYAREEESKFCLILDTRMNPAAGPDCGAKFEKAVSLAAGLAWHFIGEGAELEFLMPGEYLPRGAGRNHLYRILRSLAVVDWKRARAGTAAELEEELSGIVDTQTLGEILSEKVFKIILTSKEPGSFPSTIWRSCHAIYFDEL